MAGKKVKPSGIRQVAAMFRAGGELDDLDGPEEPKPPAEKIARRESRPRAARRPRAPRSVSPIAVGLVAPRGRGRPPGKHSNPDYTQATAYVRSEVHDAVQLELWQLKIAKRQKGGKKLEYSELVEKLLVEWLEKQGHKIGKA